MNRRTEFRWNDSGAEPAEPADFTFSPQQNLTFLTPVSPAAQSWVADRLPPEAPRWGSSIVIEPRCAAAILEGILEDGLTID